ncbi:flagellar biosynthesis protein FlgA, partial [Paenibacillus sepulcri]|nr:flagellar biosynthesis protein FlgA [Paenibacillus sepulcri]
LFDQPVTVASVKTSANIEIDDTDNPNLLSLASGDKEKMYASRRDANGMIDYINLNLQEEQWLELDSLCKSGKARIVIAYSSQSLDIADAAAAQTEAGS